MLAIDLQSGPLADVWRGDPCAVLYELAARAPGEAAELRIGDERILLVQDAEAARHIARARPENYHKHFGGFAKFFGASRLTSDGEQWERLLKLSQPSIAATDPASVVRSAERHFGAAIDGLLADYGSGPLLVDPYLDKAAAAVIADVTFGFGADDISPTLIDDFRSILRYSSLVTWNVAGAEVADSPPARLSAMMAANRLRSGLDNLLVDSQSSSDVSPLLRILIDTPDDQVDRFAEVCTLLFAGSDTSSTSIGWAMYLLANAATLQERLRREIKTGLNSSGLTLEGVFRLEGVAAFQNEAMRIFPPIPILSRIAVEADAIGTLRVAAGQKVLISVIGLHHDPRTFPQPRRVSLDRFPHGATPRDPLAHFQPFSTGRRACGGARIANIEVATALTLLIGRLQMQPAGNEPLAFEWLASLRRRGGQRLRLAAA